MTVAERLLLVGLVITGVGWIATAWLLVTAKRRVHDLRHELERPHLIPTTSQAVRRVVSTAVKVKDHGFVGALRSSIDELALWADVERPDLASMAAADGSITIMFSDIQDSTALNHRLGDRGWVGLLRRHDRLLHHAIEAHAGHVVKTQGDGFMVAFAEPQQAIDAAFQIQRRLRRSRTPTLAGIKVRIGAHKGSAVRRDGDLFGRNVAYAARVAAQAHGGEVLVSDAVLDGLPEGSVTVLDTRTAELKGIPGEQTLHALKW